MNSSSKPQHVSGEGVWYLDQVFLYIQEHFHVPVHPGRILQVKSTPGSGRQRGARCSMRWGCSSEVKTISKMQTFVKTLGMRKSLFVVTKQVTTTWMLTLRSKLLSMEGARSQLTIPARSWTCRRTPKCDRERRLLWNPGNTWPKDGNVAVRVCMSAHRFR